MLSPANDAATPLLTPGLYVPTLIPLKLTPVLVATPDPFVVADPTDTPLSVKPMLLPLTPVPLDVSVAVKLTVLP